eukprot:SAG11_NODE_171_length_13596_cov_15.767356_12_plen_76_part_01
MELAPPVSGGDGEGAGRVVRVRFDRGWVDLRDKTGAPLLAVVAMPADDAPQDEKPPPAWPPPPPPARPPPPPPAAR